MIVKWKLLSHVRLFATHGLEPTRLFCPWNSPGKNTGMGSLSFLQGIFPTQGSNLGLPQCRWILYHLSHQGSLRMLGWVAYHFSRGSSWPRNWPGVSWITGRLFTNWATREAQSHKYYCSFNDFFPARIWAWLVNSRCSNLMIFSLLGSELGW